MGHNISGIITSFIYEGEFPNVVLVGNYYLIPIENESFGNYSEGTIEPYEELTTKTRKILKELSFKGKCAYIETEYFGGAGSQLSEVWKNGEKTHGPLFSFDNLDADDLLISKGVMVVSDSINESLKLIGIYKHDGKDEFDSVGLGLYRSNKEIIEKHQGNLSRE